MCMYFTKTISRNFIMVEGYEGEVLSRFTGEREREGGREGERGEVVAAYTRTLLSVRNTE